MVTFPLSGPLVKIAVPTREEMKRMLTTPAVAITTIVCATILGIAALAGVVFLAFTGHDTAVIGALIAGVMTALGGLLSSRMRQTIEAIKTKAPE